jgi:hypothetical protein
MEEIKILLDNMQNVLQEIYNGIEKGTIITNDKLYQQIITRTQKINKISKLIINYNNKK